MTGLVASEVGWFDSMEFDAHAAPSRHPECPERVQSIRARLETSGLAVRMKRLEPVPVSEQALLRVHTSDYLNQLTRLHEAGGGYLDPDTYLSAGSLNAARLAAGAAEQAVCAVLQGTLRSALCTVRPPGHHACPGQGMGFCLFNNVAIAAEVALSHPDIERVAIFDWDVHHGNGTEETFYERADVFYASTHQRPAYPGSGGASDVGAGAGRGCNLNVPLRPGDGDAQLLAAWDERIEPALRTFGPQFLLVSAGFDASARDPLAQLEVTTLGYRKLSARVVALAREICGGRLVSVLEGGYDLTALADDVQAHVETLLD